MKKQRIVECDFIRALSAMGIIMNHLCIELGRRGVVLNEYWGSRYANGDFGWLFVTLFFVLSGAMMYENYPGTAELNIRKFYYKRWKSIFPVFYLAWLFYYIQRIFKYGKIFYNGSPLRLFWTIFGMDGYLSFRMDTYYLLGEWFLGPIIILYILYPLILKAFDCIGKIKTIVVIIVLFLLVDKLNVSIQSGPFRSITSCLLSFCMGMLLISYKDRLEKLWCLIPAVILSCVLLVIKLPVSYNQNILVHILGGLLFISLFNAGKWIMKAPVINKIIACISSLSYPIFLLQHIIIDQVASGFSFETYTAVIYFGLFVFTSVIIIFHAWGLSQIGKGWVNSALFKKADKKFLN